MGRTCAEFLLEGVGEVIAVGVAYGGSHRFHGKLLFLQKDLCPVHPQVGQIGHNGVPCFRLEDPADGGDYFGYFDNPDVHYVTSRTAVSSGRTVRILEFEYQSTRLYVLNFADGEVAKDGSRFAPATVRFDGTLVWQPVWVDLMSGTIATVPQRYVGRVDGKLMLKDIPVSSEPVMIAPGKLVPRRVAWMEMTPAEIVDSIYMPWQNPQGTNKGPVKMDVSKEPWQQYPYILPVRWNRGSHPPGPAFRYPGRGPAWCWWSRD